MDDDIKIIGITVFSILLLYIGVMTLAFSVDKTNIRLLINGKAVYSGKAHFIDVQSIGENGNTKKVTIYKDIYQLIQVKKYITDDVIIDSN